VESRSEDILLLGCLWLFRVKWREKEEEGKKVFKNNKWDLGKLQRERDVTCREKERERGERGGENGGNRKWLRDLGSLRERERKRER